MVEVNPASKAELKAETEYRRVPFVTVSGVALDPAAAAATAPIHVVDSTDIMSALYQTMGEARRRGAAQPLAPDTKRWRMWTDDHLLHLFPPNIYVYALPPFASSAAS